MDPPELAPLELDVTPELLAPLDEPSTPLLELPLLELPAFPPEPVTVHVPVGVVQLPARLPFETLPVHISVPPDSVAANEKLSPETEPEVDERPPWQLTAIEHPVCAMVHVSLVQPSIDQEPEMLEQLELLFDELHATAAATNAKAKTPKIDFMWPP